MSHVNAAETRLLRILLAVHNVAGGATRERVEVGDVQRVLQPDLKIERDALEDALDVLITRGLIDGFQSLAGLNDVFLLPGGKELAMRFEATRSNPADRQRQLQDDYLRWVYEMTELNGLSPTVSEFMATTPSFHGASYTDRELLIAGMRLKEGGFIEGEGRLSYPAPAQPRLTARGRRVVEQGASVHDEDARPSAVQHFNTTVNGNANVANASPGAIQVLSVDTEWVTKASSVLDAIEQASTMLPFDMRQTVANLVTEARSTVADDSPPRAKRAFSALGSFLSDTASGALGGLLGAQALALLPLLGG